MADPLTTASLALLFGAGISSVNGGGKTPPSDGKWKFPLPAWRGYAPTRSQEYRAPDHHGCDLMYVRKPGGADAMWPSGLRGTGELARSHGNARFFFPDSVYACAARDGTLWHVGKGGPGHFLVIEHGAPFATFYTHLSSCLFPPTSRGASGIRVKAGQALGVVGFSSLDAARMMHLHFEVWYKGGSASHVDPWPLLERAPLPEGKP